MAAETATDALYRALSSPEPDPKVVHSAIEEIRDLSGQNVIAVLGAKIDAQTSRIESVEARIEDLRQVIWRVIWPLIVLLAVPVFGLLYKVLTTS